MTRRFNRDDFTDAQWQEIIDRVEEYLESPAHRRHRPEFDEWEDEEIAAFWEIYESLNQ